MSLAQSLVASLAASQPNVDDKTLVIDHYTRSIIIPSSIKSLGVENDDDVLRLNFRMPRYLGTVDLHKFNIYINYINAQGKDDVYDVDDATIVGDDVVFSWLVGPTATAYIGTTSFNVRMVVVDSDAVIKQEYNTAVAKLQVLQGLKCNKRAISKYSDLLAQWERKLFGISGTEEAKLVAASETQQQRIVEKGNEVLATIPQEYTATYNLANEGVRIKADAIICSAQGELVAVSDSSDDYLRGLKIFGKTTQAQTPSPDNPQELVSLGDDGNINVTVYGKNLISYPYRDPSGTTNNGITYTVNSDGSITVNGTATANSSFTLMASTDIIPLPAGWICTSLGNGYGNGIVQIQNDMYKDGVYIGTLTNSLENAAKRLLSQPHEIHGARLKVVSGVTINNVTVYPMLCIAEQISGYEQYRGKQSIAINNSLAGIPVTSGGNYTDSNGQQWICDEIDFERGVYVQRVYALVSDYASDWKLSGNSTTDYNAFYRMNTSLPTMIKGTNNPVICTHFTKTRDPIADHTVCVSGGLSNQEVYFFVPKSEFPDVESWTDYVLQQVADGTPITTCYILAAPIETPLTADEIAAFKALKSHYPNTTVVNDAGAGMAVRYNADTETWIKNLIDEKIAAAIANL